MTNVSRIINKIKKSS